MKNTGLFQILAVIAVTIAILYGINYLTSRQAISNYGEVSASAEQSKGNEMPEQSNENQEPAIVGNVDGNHQPGPYMGTSSGQDVPALTSSQAGCPTNQHLTPQDLLPSDDSSAWAKMNPVGAGSLNSKNFLQAGHHIGIDTVGQTLRNANLQLRSEPPNPRLMVSPWLNSTIEADTNRRPFELGTC